ncbi:hypothetical protein [Ponticoccus litoralis]|uniref:Uncharacterized protein n=1 Tax=Ponticoccus litoralis TaxID=422297 RepID=A0AAW9S6X8_9RHOB
MTTKPRKNQNAAHFAFAWFGERVTGYLAQQDGPRTRTLASWALIRSTINIVVQVMYTFCVCLFSVTGLMRYRFAT